MMLNIPPKWLNGVAIIKHRPEFHRKFESWTVWESARRPTYHTWLSSTSSVKRNRECFSGDSCLGVEFARSRGGVSFTCDFWFLTSPHVDRSALMTRPWKHVKCVGWKGETWEWSSSDFRPRLGLARPSVCHLWMTGILQGYFSSDYKYTSEKQSLCSAFHQERISSRRFMMKRFTGLIK